MLLFTMCSKTTVNVRNGIGNGLDYLVVGLTEDNEKVRHNVVWTPTSNNIQSGGKQSSSLPSNDTDNRGSFVVDSGKLVVSATYYTVLLL